MPAKKAKSAKTVFIVSGATGRICSEVIDAALAQFGKRNTRIVRRTKIRSSRSIAPIVAEAAAQSAVVFHSLVSPNVRRTLVSECERLKVPVLDVLGPALTLLEDHLQRKPRHRPGLSYQLQKERYDRLNAVDYTLEHDDGCGLADLNQADVVLVGVSRVSKSVTCFYLAYRGVCAANVPLIPTCSPPQQLLALPSEKVIGLTINVRRLRSLREARAESFGNTQAGAYIEQREIAREVRWANELMEENGWRTIDVSYMSVEEVAGRIRSMI